MKDLQGIKSALKAALAEGLEYAIQEIKKVLSEKSRHYDDFIHHQGRFNSNQKAKSLDTVSESHYNRTNNQINQALLALINSLKNEDVVLAPAASPSNYSQPENIAVSNEADLEKIIGKSTLTSMEWFAQMVEASKSVCRIVVDKEKEYWTGTGFLVKGGCIFTNQHVLENKDDAAHATIEFNFLSDKSRKVTYKLDAESWVGNKDFDFARVKVLDDSSNPIGNWNFLELDTDYEVKAGIAVPIIQHPDGKELQVSIEGNFVNRVSPDGRYIFYTTDTLPGSSGSPVFNENWKVIALHHAGMNSEDANRGILFKMILKYLTSIAAPPCELDSMKAEKNEELKEEKQAGKTYHQTAEKIYNIDKIDTGTFN